MYGFNIIVVCSEARGQIPAPSFQEYIILFDNDIFVEKELGDSLDNLGVVRQRFAIKWHS